MMKVFLFVLMLSISNFSMANGVLKETTFELACINLQKDDPGPVTCLETLKRSQKEHIPYGVVGTLELTIPVSGDASYYLYNPNNISQYEKGDMVPFVAGDYTKMQIVPTTGACADEKIGTFKLAPNGIWHFELQDGTGDYGICVVVAAEESK